MIPTLSLAASHRIEEIHVAGARAPYPLAGSGHHLELLDLSDLQSESVRGGPESSGRQRSAHGHLGDVRQHRRQPPGPAQRVHYPAPLRPALRAHQVPPQGPDSIEMHRVEHPATLGEALPALGVSSSPNGQADFAPRGPADDARHFLDAPRSRHRLRHPPEHSSEVVRSRFADFPVAGRTGNGTPLAHLRPVSRRRGSGR